LRLWAALTPQDKADLAQYWDWHRLAPQTPPEAGADGAAWRIWAFIAGRGAGKTRAGAEWVSQLVAKDEAKRIGLIGATMHEVRAVMVEGQSGLLNVLNPAERPHYHYTARRLEWPNGAVAEMFSGARPNSLRGPQFDAIWADELAKWRYPDATMAMAQLALRLGTRPRMLITTTPSARPEISRLLVTPEVALTRAPTAVNARNLSDGFLASLEAVYGGTALARQELGGEILEDDETALFRRAWIDAARVRAAPPLKRVVVGVDPPAGAGPRAAACGIVAAGMAGDGHFYVLEDASVRGQSPAQWAARAMRCAEANGAAEIVAEANQGGEMVRALLEAAGMGRLRVTLVRATDGKRARAQPSALKYERGFVHHAGAFGALEDEMCLFGGERDSGVSPDRMDALVWALTSLMRRVASPRVLLV
jgi:phage terminase large subunit-like protein